MVVVAVVVVVAMTVQQQVVVVITVVVVIVVITRLWLVGVVVAVAWGIRLARRREGPSPCSLARGARSDRRGREVLWRQRHRQHLYGRG